MADGEATFKINIDGNASVASKDIAVSARLAAKSITEYENEVKTLSADLRRLKGNSDEVTATKAALRKRIDEAKTSASSLTIELNKQGTSYAAAAAAAKKYGTASGKLPNLRRGVSAAAGAVGGGAKKALGPVAAKIGGGAAKALSPVTKKLGALFAPLAKSLGAKLAPLGQRLSKFGAGAKKSIGSLGKAVKEDASSITSSLGSVVSALGPTGTAIAAALAVSFVGFAAAGAALGAFSLANADAYAKMQRSREALLGNAKDAGALGDQIGVLAAKVPQGVAELNELSRELSKTRLSGKAIVDTLNAVAQASGAVDASAGSKIQELLTRFQHTGRFAINQFDLQGTGIDFDDVAKEYASGAKKTVEAARKELLYGEVPIEKAAAAMRKVTEKKFGDINLKNAFSLENAPKKLKDQLSILSKDVDLTPITKSLQEAFGQLSPNAPLGAAVKAFMEGFGAELVNIASKSIPILVEGFKWLLVWALQLGARFYETKNKIKDAFEKEDWAAIGGAIIKGLAMGVLGGSGTITKAMGSLAGNVKDAFTGKMEIHSPSRVFARFGEHTTEGYAQGVERGSRRAQSAVEGMVQTPKTSGPGASSGAPISIAVNIHGAPTDDAKEMGSPAFLAALTQAVRMAVAQKGLAA